MSFTPVLRSIGLAAAAALSILIPIAPAAAAAAAPEMSVTISDGVTTVKPGMGVTYTASVRNMGADPVDAKVVVSVPSYVSIGDAGVGTVDKKTTTWSVTIAPHESSKLKLAVTVGDIPKSEVRVTAVVSVYVDGAKPSPLIRSADADHIQGVADTPSPTPGTASTATAHGDATWTITIVLVAVLIVACVVVATIVLRRRSLANGTRAQP